MRKQNLVRVTRFANVKKKKKSSNVYINLLNIRTPGLFAAALHPCCVM